MDFFKTGALLTFHPENTAKDFFLNLQKNYVVTFVKNLKMKSIMSLLSRYLSQINRK